MRIESNPAQVTVTSRWGSRSLPVKIDGWAGALLSRKVSGRCLNRTDIPGLKIETWATPPFLLSAGPLFTTSERRLENPPEWSGFRTDESAPSLRRPRL